MLFASVAHPQAAPVTGLLVFNQHCHGVDRESARWDPKDGELCLARLKSGETLMEDRKRF